MTRVGAQKVVLVASVLALGAGVLHWVLSPAQLAVTHAALPARVEAGAPTGPLDDLLHYTDAHLAVSSKVDNPRDRAEHIADGRFETAWNGKTGDLVGGWIGFRVPRATAVHHVELTVGFDARSRKGEDLFLANHRIHRVKILRDGAVVREQVLDPDMRAPQRIAFDPPLAGGDFKIEVLAVKPGTRAGWRELVVSELRVFGRAGLAKRGTPALPRVSVGAFDERPPLSTVGLKDAGARPPREHLSSAASAKALCAEWQPGAEASWQRLVEEGQQGPCPPEELSPSCSTSIIGSQRGVTLHAFTTSEGSVNEGLALEYKKRVYVLNSTISSRDNCDPGCFGPRSGGEYVGFRVDGTAPSIVTIRYTTWLAGDFMSANLEDGGSDPSLVVNNYASNEIQCRLEADGPDCSDKVVDVKDVSGGETPHTPDEWVEAWEADGGISAP